jgi:hypothetical protein
MDGSAARLHAKIGLAAPHMMSALAALWADPQPLATYQEWLRVMHATIRSTEPLMIDALQRCLALRDPVATGFATYLARHIREELGHDEWVREDYAATGADPAELDEQVPDASIAALVGAQYYWIKHVHPVALLGHICVLEGYPPGPELARRLSARTGLPLGAFRSVERHSVLDVRHRDEAYRAVDTLALTPWHERLIGVSALHTVQAVCDVVAEARWRCATARQSVAS